MQTFNPGEVVSSPYTDGFENGDQRKTIFRDRVADAGWAFSFLMPHDDPIIYQVLQVPDQHPLGNARDAAAQLTGTHRPVR